MKSGIVSGLVGVGVLLVVLSLVWTQIFTGESSWTPEKAEQWAEVKDRLHNLSFIVNSPEPPRRHASMEEAKAEYDKVKEMANQLRSEFENAYDGPRTTATILKWSGVSVLLVGIGLQFAWKEQG